MTITLDRIELGRQAVANAAIEGIAYTPDELALFAYFDRENLDEATCLELLRRFLAGDFEVPTAA